MHYIALVKSWGGNFTIPVKEKNMTKIKFGAIVVDGRGKLGGHVLAKNRGGNYMRTKTTPTNPQTSHQSNVRAMFATIASGWSGLSEDERKSWNDKAPGYARTNIFGDLKNPTGKALYQRLNQNLLLSEQVQKDVCPNPEDVISAGIDSAQADGALATFSIDTLRDTTGSKLLVFATPSVSAGTSFVKDKTRLVEVQDGAPAGSVDIAAGYAARFGAIAAGDVIYVGLKTVNANGQASTMQTARVVVG